MGVGNSTSSTLTVKGYWVLGAIACIFACMAVVFFATAKHRDALESCRLNLFYLARGAHDGSPQDVKFWDAQPTGSAFWENFQRWPVIGNRPITPRYLLCPVKASPKGRTGCDYRGPALSWRVTAPEDPIGSDRAGNHGEGQALNVVLKNCEIHAVPGSDPRWARALQTTSD